MVFFLKKNARSFYL